MYFIYDREDVILDFVDRDGEGPNPPTIDQRYLHGPGIDQVFAQDDAAGSVQWHLTDHLGTVRDLVDNASVVVNHILYDAYGNVVSRTNATLESRYLFTGREFDAETKLHYYRARYYDSEAGRFVSDDPIAFRAGHANLSTYAGNSPVGNMDPSGNFLVGAIFGGAIDGLLEALTNDCATLGSVLAEFAKGAAIGAVTGGIGHFAKAGKLGAKAAKVWEKHKDLANAVTDVSANTLGEGVAKGLGGGDMSDNAAAAAGGLLSSTAGSFAAGAVRNKFRNRAFDKLLKDPDLTGPKGQDVLEVDDYYQSIGPQNAESFSEWMASGVTSKASSKALGGSDPSCQCK